MGATAAPKKSNNTCFISRMTTDQHHTECLEQLCRVCGSFFQQKYNRYSCSDHQAALQSAFSIDVKSESCVDVYRSHFCKCCYATMHQIESAKKESHIYNHGVTVCEWQKHTDDDCKVSPPNGHNTYIPCMVYVHVIYRCLQK